VLTVSWLAIIVVAGGCGGGELSLTEYVDQVDAIQARALRQYEVIAASPQGAVLVAEGEQLADFAPRDLQVALEQVTEIQSEALGAARAVDPPEQVAVFHQLYFRELPMEELAARAGTAATWEELSESSEMAAYRAALVDDRQVCADFQAELDGTAERGVFVDTPWIPGKLKEIVDFAVGCSALPEHPEDLYRPPPASTP